MGVTNVAACGEKVRKSWHDTTEPACLHLSKCLRGATGMDVMGCALLCRWQIGHRSFFGGSKTINVNMTLMAELLLSVQALRRKHPGSSYSSGSHAPGSEQWSRPARDLMWAHFCKRVSQGHKARVGKIKLRRSDQSIYTYPAPDCLCLANTDIGSPNTH